MGGEVERVEASARCFPWLFRMLAFGPVYFIALVYGEACAAAAWLRHWPVPSVDDPGTLPTGWLHVLSWWAFLGLIPAAVLFVLVGARQAQGQHSRRWLAVFLAAWALLIWFPFLDPGTVEWWVD